MVNTWKYIHKKDIFWNQYKQYKKDILENHFCFDVIEKYLNWSIWYDKYHKIYSVSLGCYWLNRYFKTKKTAKQFIKKHIDYNIDDLKNENLS